MASSSTKRSPRSQRPVQSFEPCSLDSFVSISSSTLFSRFPTALCAAVHFVTNINDRSVYHHHSPNLPTYVRSACTCTVTFCLFSFVTAYSPSADAALYYLPCTFISFFLFHLFTPPRQRVGAHARHDPSHVPTIPRDTINPTPHTSAQITYLRRFVYDFFFFSS
jgi:hypothetical protein